MPSSFLMICFVDDKTTIVDHKLCLYDIFLFLSRMILLLFPFIYRPWNLLFSRTNESIKSRKKSFNFLWRFQPFGYLIYFLRNWYAFSNQTFYLLNVSADGVLVQIT